MTMSSKTKIKVLFYFFNYSSKMKMKSQLNMNQTFRRVKMRLTLFTLHLNSIFLKSIIMRLSIKSFIKREN